MSAGVSREIVCKWQSAVEAVDEGRLREAVGLFWEIRDFSAKIWFNLSTVDGLGGDLTAADEKLKECLQRDEYLTIAHFQRGVIASQLGRLREAVEMFAQAQRNLRNNDSIDYKQLGMDLRLTCQQIQHNQSVVDSYLKSNRGTSKISVEELATLPLSLFRPARSLVDNLEKKQFLKTAKVVSAVPDIVQKKDSNGVGRPHSSSAPTSPSPHRRLPANSKAATPPPSRPPPRLPPSSVSRARDGRPHNDATGRDVGSEQQYQLGSAVPQRRLPDRIGPSFSPLSAAMQGHLRHRNPDLSSSGQGDSSVRPGGHVMRGQSSQSPENETKGARPNKPPPRPLPPKFAS